MVPIELEAVLTFNTSLNKVGEKGSYFVIIEKKSLGVYVCVSNEVLV